MITYLHVIKSFEGAEEDGDSVAETNFPDILTCNGLIFVGKEYTTKSTKIYTPRKFLRVQYYPHPCKVIIRCYCNCLILNFLIVNWIMSRKSIDMPISCALFVSII